MCIFGFFVIHLVKKSKAWASRGIRVTSPSRWHSACTGRRTAQIRRTAQRGRRTAQRGRRRTAQRRRATQRKRRFRRRGWWCAQRRSARRRWSSNKRGRRRAIRRSRADGSSWDAASRATSGLLCSHLNYHLFA